MKAKISPYRGLQRASKRFYWNEVVKRFNRLAYLHHIVDMSSESLECEDEIDEILSIETYRWEKRGLKVHLVIRDVPLPEGERHFIDGQYGSVATWEALRRFKKLVEDAEYERDRRKREGRE